MSVLQHPGRKGCWSNPDEWVMLGLIKTGRHQQKGDWMFGILSRLWSKPSGSRHANRLGVELLEERCCPDGSHITLSAVAQAGHLVQLTGSVTGGQTAGVSVLFSGAVSGGTMTNSDGTFSYTTSNASLG